MIDLILGFGRRQLEMRKSNADEVKSISSSATSSTLSSAPSSKGSASSQMGFLDEIKALAERRDSHDSLRNVLNGCKGRVRELKPHQHHQQQQQQQPKSSTTKPPTSVNGKPLFGNTDCGDDSRRRHGTFTHLITDALKL